MASSAVMKAKDGEPLYCAQQIHIPPELPDILKQFTKAAIRADPADLLRWSADYFNRESGNKLTLPEAITRPSSAARDSEDPPLASSQTQQATASGVSLDILPTLYAKLNASGQETVDVTAVIKTATEVGVQEAVVSQLLAIGDWSTTTSSQVPWLDFVALAFSTATTGLEDTMKQMCTTIEGGLSKDMFKKIYTFLAKTDGDISTDKVTEVCARVDAFDGDEIINASAVL